MFLSSQAVSVLKQQQETTYIALPTLANSSRVRGFWPGLDWFLSQCLDQASLSMRKTLGWTVFFIALTAEVKVASNAVEEENTAPLHPPGRPTLHSEVGHKKDLAAQSGFTFLSVIWARERVPLCNPSSLLEHQVEGEEGRGSTVMETCSSCLLLQVWSRGGAPGRTHLALKLWAVHVHRSKSFSKVCCLLTI